MEGVTILQTFEHTATTWGWSWWFMIPIILIVVCAISIFSYIMGDNTEARKKMIPILTGWLVFCLLLTLGLAHSQTKLPTEYTYQVYLDENVNMEEFVHVYEIVKQQGITYIVKEVGEG